MKQQLRESPRAIRLMFVEIFALCGTHPWGVSIRVLIMLVYNVAFFLYLRNAAIILPQRYDIVGAIAVTAIWQFFLCTFVWVAALASVKKK